MSTTYRYKKCKLFGFSQQIDYVLDKQHSSPSNTIIVNDEPLTLSDEFIEHNKQMVLNGEQENVPTFVIDLTGKWFSDINILTDENKTGDQQQSSFATQQTNANYRRDDNELSKIITGQSTQLEAFTKNVYTVIYGKKTANIPQGINNAHIFNHNVIDSLARNGVVSDQVSDNVLSVHKLFNQLEKLYLFNIFFVHPSLELEYVEHESPTEISHPIYTKGVGEICAVFYRCLLLRFFPYLTIVSESMRENAYLF